MTAKDYRARADEALEMADVAFSYDLILTYERLARDWMRLATACTIGRDDRSRPADPR
ncbi:hypothetical protein [Phenylobacterium sp.]|uniref:hypothetical protein n=1 Tax=Phenylobacterium sp. TaxID=1871053 RepID=UPI00273556CD|nr:hypothetical protein [Phenylobacterium sp.]MDP3660840.1 hypothetical protein [Phenylobacterium sp.]